MLRRLALPIAIASTLFTVPAIASPLTSIFDIETSGFTDVAGSSSAPVDPVSLVVSLSFSPASGDQFDNGSGIRLLRSSVPISGGLAFDYDSTNDILTFGGAGLGGIGLAAGTGNVLAVVNTPYTGVASFGGFIYATNTSPGIYESLTGTVAVPEPGSMTFVLGAMVAVLVRRRSA